MYTTTTTNNSIRFLPKHLLERVAIIIIIPTTNNPNTTAQRAITINTSYIDRTQKPGHGRECYDVSQSASSFQAGASVGPAAGVELCGSITVFLLVTGRSGVPCQPSM